MMLAPSAVLHAGIAATAAARLALAIGAFAAAMLAARPLAAEALVTLLSTHAVEITSNYTGADITIFGAIERDARTVSRGQPYQMVVAVKGPSQPIVVREKERTGLIWANADQRKFGDVPGYYALLGSAPITEIVDDGTQKSLEIGYYALTSTLESPAEEMLLKPERTRGGVFAAALLRLRREEGLYVENPQAVTFLRANTFKAQVSLPANAPLGHYEVTAYLFSGSVLLARERAGFFVRKIGFEAATAAAARSRPFLYGLAAAAMALFAGWLASVVFRRD